MENHLVLVNEDLGEVDQLTVRGEKRRTRVCEEPFKKDLNIKRLREALAQ